MNRQTKLLALVQKLETITPNSIAVQVDLISRCQLELNQKEALITKNMSPVRKREFVAGRIIVKKMLNDMGINNYSLLKDNHGCPIWPTGVAGSISHKGSLCGVLLTNDKSYQSLGLDLEKTECLEQGVWKVFATSDEIDQASSLNLQKEIFANMLFSAKEATFKCLFPVYTTKTPTISEIKIKVEAKTKGHFSFSFSFSESKVLGLLVVTEDYTISWCFC